jgi:hypothetical protein
MIKCGTRGDRKLVSIECNKMKEAEPFRDTVAGLERVQISASDSSLAVANLRTEAKDEAGHVDAAIKVLAQFGSLGATNKEWLGAFKESTELSKATFDRVIREIEHDDRVHWDGERYYAYKQMKVSSVKRCQSSVMTLPGMVSCHPPLGDDTETTAFEQK